MHFGSGVPQIIRFPLEVYGWLTLKSIRWRIGSSHFYFQRNYLGGRKLEICGKATGWMLDCSSSIHKSLMINDKRDFWHLTSNLASYNNAHNLLLLVIHAFLLEMDMEYKIMKLLNTKIHIFFCKSNFLLVNRPKGYEVQFPSDSPHNNYSVIWQWYLMRIQNNIL